MWIIIQFLTEKRLNQGLNTLFRLQTDFNQFANQFRKFGVIIRPKTNEISWRERWPTYTFARYRVFVHRGIEENKMRDLNRRDKKGEREKVEREKEKER